MIDTGWACVYIQKLTFEVGYQATCQMFIPVEPTSTRQLQYPNWIKFKTPAADNRIIASHWWFQIRLTATKVKPDWLI